MKQILLFFLITLFSINTHAQTISIVGSGVNGWPPTTGPEITLSTADNVNYTISNLNVSTGFVKFRQDFDWAINWGSNTFPTGTGTQGGADIPTAAGVYTVNFNRTTGYYEFIGVVTYPVISLVGTGVGGWSSDVDMATADGVAYTKNNQSFTAGFVKFRQAHDWATNWGAVDFPAGTGLQNGAEIPVPEATFNVTFNRTTGAYSFNNVSIGVLGSSLIGWDDDIDLTTTDGVNFTLANYPFAEGEVKFRQDNTWDINWGGIFPSGTGVAGSGNIIVPAGNYDVSFNRNTLAFNFTQVLSSNEFATNSVKAYPNPTKSVWNIAAVGEPITLIEVMDVLGKRVIQTQNPAIDASQLSSGIYFAKIATATASQTIKLVKE